MMLTDFLTELPKRVSKCVYRRSISSTMLFTTRVLIMARSWWVARPDLWVCQLVITSRATERFIALMWTSSDNLSCAIFSSYKSYIALLCFCSVLSIGLIAWGQSPSQLSLTQGAGISYFRARALPQDKLLTATKSSGRFRWPLPLQVLPHRDVQSAPKVGCPWVSGAASILQGFQRFNPPLLVPQVQTECFRDSQRHWLGWTFGQKPGLPRTSPYWLVCSWNFLKALALPTWTANICQLLWILRSKQEKLVTKSLHQGCKFNTHLATKQKKTFRRFNNAQRSQDLEDPRSGCTMSQSKSINGIEYSAHLCTLQVSFGTGEVTGVFVEDRARRTAVKRSWSHKSGEVFLCWKLHSWPGGIGLKFINTKCLACVDQGPHQSILDCANVSMMCHVLQDVICFGQRGPGIDTSSTNVPVAGKGVSFP